MKTPFLDRGGKTDGRNWREENEVLHSHGASHESAGREQEYRIEGTAWEHPLGLLPLRLAGNEWSMGCQL